MRRVLDAINALQRVPFCINEPLLDFMLRSEALAAKHHLDMVTAEELADHDRFYVPLNMDFRGRIMASRISISPEKTVSVPSSCLRTANPSVKRAYGGSRCMWPVLLTAMAGPTKKNRADYHAKSG
jgi:hypothetical protein